MTTTAKHSQAPRPGDTYKLNGHTVRVLRIDHCGRIHYQTAGWLTSSYMEAADFAKHAVRAEGGAS